MPSHWLTEGRRASGGQTPGFRAALIKPNRARGDAAHFAMSQPTRTSPRRAAPPVASAVPQGAAAEQLSATEQPDLPAASSGQSAADAAKWKTLLGRQAVLRKEKEEEKKKQTAEKAAAQAAHPQAGKSAKGKGKKVVNVNRVLEYEFGGRRRDQLGSDAAKRRWDRLEAHARDCIAPARAYMLACEGKDMDAPLTVLRAARLFNPSHIKSGMFDQGVVVALLRELCAMIPALEEIRDDMLYEVPAYVLQANNTLPQNAPVPAPEGFPAHGPDDPEAIADVDILQWWRGMRPARLPNLFSGLRLTLLLHPNSGGPERVFSLVNTYVNDQQQSMYDQTLKARVMLQYNRRPAATQNTRTNKSYRVTWDFMREYYAQAAAVV